MSSSQGRIRRLGGLGNATYHDVETTKLVDSALNDSGDLVLLANIALHSNGLGGELGVVESLVDHVGGLLARFEVDVGQNDVSTFGGEEECALAADSGATAGDDGDTMRKAKTRHVDEEDRVAEWGNG